MPTPSKQVISVTVEELGQAFATAVRAAVNANTTTDNRLIIADVQGVPTVGSPLDHLRSQARQTLKDGVRARVSFSFGMTAAVFEMPYLWIEYFHRRGVTAADMVFTSSFFQSFHAMLCATYPRLTDDRHSYSREAFEHVKQVFDVYSHLATDDLLDDVAGTDFLISYGSDRIRAANEFVHSTVLSLLCEEEDVSVELATRAQKSVSLTSRGVLGALLGATVSRARASEAGPAPTAGNSPNGGLSRREKAALRNAQQDGRSSQNSGNNGGDGKKNQSKAGAGKRRK